MLRVVTPAETPRRFTAGFIHFMTPVLTGRLSELQERVCACLFTRSDVCGEALRLDCASVRFYTVATV